LKLTIAQQLKHFRAAATQQQKEFESKITRQQSASKALSVGLQKVSAQLELTKAWTETVLSDQ
jgi:hypothetical protein